MVSRDKKIQVDGKPLEFVDKFKCFGSMFDANGQGTEEIRRRINLACSAFSRLQSCPWSRREISLRTTGKVYQTLVRSISLYGCKTWPVRVAEGCWRSLNMTAFVRILRVRRSDGVLSVELRRRLYLASIPTLLVQRRLH